jgi:hypothetical protein
MNQSDRGGRNNVRPRNRIEQFLRLLANSFPLLRILLLHLADRVFFARLQRRDVYFADTRYRSVEAWCGLNSTLAGAHDLEG